MDWIFELLQAQLEGSVPEVVESISPKERTLFMKIMLDVG